MLSGKIAQVWAKAMICKRCGGINPLFSYIKSEHDLGICKVKKK
jgi:hypothetical protein